MTKSIKREIEGYCLFSFELYSSPFLVINGVGFNRFPTPNSQENKMFRNKIASMLIAYRYAKKQTQTQVSEKLGVTFQQVQKYEKGANGISSERLLLFCQVYNINLQEFQTGDPYAVLDGADIQPHYKEKALHNIEKLEEKKNDKSRSDESMARESISEGTYI
nr:transcriptional regulator [uncultured Mediterranean phage uvMED]